MKIRNEIDTSEKNMSDIEKPTQRVVEHRMTDIYAATMCEVQTIIQHAKPNSSCLDPLPTSLLNSTLPAHIQILTHLINTYFKSGTVPRELKKAAVTRLLNKLHWIETH